MSKFNTATAAPARGAGPIVAEPTPSTTTALGGPGYVRDLQGELFMLAATNLVGEQTYHEGADARDARFTQLVRQAAVNHPAWTARLLLWLRTPGLGNLRSAPIVGAMEFVKARLDAGSTFEQAGEALGRVDQRGLDRAVVDQVLRRGDEPGEALAYWMSRYGRALPMPVKRGLGDAALRLYREYPLLKYDTGSHGVRFADVVELCHPAGRRAGKDALFKYAIDRRHGRGEADPELLPMVAANARLRALADGEPEAMLDSGRLRAAGMTWEDVLSLVGSKVSKVKLWEALIPVMGMFALARNLRSFDEAGVSDQAAQLVIDRLTDPAQVTASGIFPYQWLAAYEAAPSLRWGHALDKALQASLVALPELPGRSLILVDTSDSMNGAMSGKSKISRVKAAAVFGVALAAKNGQADLVGFADGTFEHKVRAGGSVIREVSAFCARTGEVGHGTDITGSVIARYRGHDRVFVFSDMQTIGGYYARGVTGAVPASVPLYGFNLAGYRAAAFDAGATNRIELGGLTDATFRMIPLIEAGRCADWPF
jgi:hypothetical protein